MARILRSALPLAMLLLSACGGSGGGASAPAASSFTVGGAVTGLAGSVTLRNNDGDDLTVTADGNFTFVTSITNGSTYAVTVLTQPNGQTCSVSTGAGTVSGGNVSDVAVTCSANAYKVGGSVAGLAGGTVVLQDNNGDDLSVLADGTFTFTTSVADGSPYAVTVLAQPIGQTCIVNTGAGTVAGSNVGNVAVVCSNNTYSLGGAISGLTGTVILRNNGGDDLTVAADGNFTFATKVGHGNTYKVEVFSQPSGQTCSVSTGAGTVSGGNVSNVAVTCSTNAYKVGGSIAGLIGTVVLQDNNGDNLTVSANGNFTFATPVANGSPYSVTVLTQPWISLSCSVANGSGTISLGDVSNVAITCATNTYPVGGTVSGLNGTIELQNNGADNHTVKVNGPFSFPTVATYGDPYSVSILTQPVRQLCSVSKGTGTATATIDVAVSCLSKLGGSMQGAELSLASASAVAAVSTFAGTASNNADGIGGTARFYTPAAIVSDGANLYVADRFNHNIRKIELATGMVSTLAGSGVAGAVDGTGTAATFNTPIGITIAGTNLYVADSSNNKIRKIVIATGEVSSLTGVTGLAGAADGAGTEATFRNPTGITTDGFSLYVADTGNNKIRKISLFDKTVSSVTGVANTGAAAGAIDGAAATATFNGPRGIIRAGTTLYVADMSNHKIRKVLISDGTTSSLTGVANTAGTAGAVDGTGAQATFSKPFGITTDGTSLYVSEWDNNKIRKVLISDGTTSSVTGVTDTAGTVGAVDGPVAGATFNQPMGITVEGVNLYVADNYNGVIRKIALDSSTVSTFAGAMPGADGTGAAAMFNTPGHITTDGTNLYVADRNNNKIRQIAIASGVVTTLAGSGVAGAADGTGTAATFSNPEGITTDGTNLYVADMMNDKIRQIVIASGVVTTLAGSVNGDAEGNGTAAMFNNPVGITTDGTNLYVADTGNRKIRQIVIASGEVTTLAGLYWGTTDGVGTAAGFRSPTGITTDGTNLYVTDSGSHKIRKIVIATAQVSSLTGVANTAGIAGAADGTGTAATFNFPDGITTDGTNLYVADTSNTKIRKIVIATGEVSSVTGVANTAGITGAVDGIGTEATFYSPYGITTDGTSLYVVDRLSGTIRKIQ